MKNVLITGATGGIGQALVEKYYKKTIRYLLLELIKKNLIYLKKNTLTI